MRQQFIRNYTEDGTAKIQFLHSEENLADPLTNNLISEPFEYLAPSYVHRE